MFSFFFHAKSATTNNQVTGLSAGADLGISWGGGGGSKFFLKADQIDFLRSPKLLYRPLFLKEKAFLGTFWQVFIKNSRFLSALPPLKIIIGWSL